jgi:Pyridoxamine 5'-phosphate oxidase
MGKFFDSIAQQHTAFAQKQHIFFVSTAPLSGKGRINVSPKGMDSFRILNDKQVAYMDVIGSGNETSAHTFENGRITFMFCSFDKVPNILRFYGKGFTVLRDSEDWEKYSSHFNIFPSTRQIIVADIDLVQTSCGFGIPFYEYVGERTTHFDWAAKKNEGELLDYQITKNSVSIDGLVSDLGKKTKI